MQARSVDQYYSLRAHTTARLSANRALSY
jgi:hypothetical protein